ncbi:MAG TPA: hypothetical protein VN924_05735 [Bryobacteraceae bacterium]|nr:hypothetical protein [Bryobacteraceae bacterium]
MTSQRLLTAMLVCSAYAAAQKPPSLIALYNFAGGVDAANPDTAANPHTLVVIGSGGVLYGTTFFGGTEGKAPSIL